MSNLNDNKEVQEAASTGLDEAERERQKKEKKKRKKKAEKEATLLKEAEKGIQTVFRIALRNHISLSSIADTKANILLSVNAIIISLALSTLIPKLDNPTNGYLVYPTMIFVTFSIVSMVLSIIATRPNISSTGIPPKDITYKKTNLLFFGNFHDLPLDTYLNAMDGLLKDREYIYQSLIKDLYFLGKVLHTKYRILRITYTVFVIGIICSVLAFAIAFKMRANQ